jgi:hypothetical protein
VLQVPAFHFDDVAIPVHVGGRTEELKNAVIRVAYLPDLEI